MFHHQVHNSSPKSHVGDSSANNCSPKQPMLHVRMNSKCSCISYPVNIDVTKRNCCVLASYHQGTNTVVANRRNGTRWSRLNRAMLFWFVQCDRIREVYASLCALWVHNVSAVWYVDQCDSELVTCIIRVMYSMLANKHAWWTEIWFATALNRRQGRPGS